MSNLINGIQYQNRYGECELEFVTSFMSIKDIHSKLEAVKSNVFDIDTAEMLALISSNRKLQQAPFADNLDKFYVVYHQAPNVAAVCKIKHLHYRSVGKPEIELALANKLDSLKYQ